MKPPSRPELASWKTLRREPVFDGSPWLSVYAETVELPDGRRVAPYYAIEQPDFVVAAAMNTAGMFLVQWNYKHGPRRVTLELPAGVINTGESPLEAAQRELLEETGHVSDDWRPLGSFTVNGNHGGGRGHYFLARNARRERPPAHGDLEEIVPAEMTPAQMRSHLLSGDVAVMGQAVGMLLSMDAAGDAR